MKMDGALGVPLGVSVGNRLSETASNSVVSNDFAVAGSNPRASTKNQRCSSEGRLNRGALRRLRDSSSP